MCGHVYIHTYTHICKWCKQIYNLLLFLLILCTLKKVDFFLFVFSFKFHIKLFKLKKTHILG